VFFFLTKKGATIVVWRINYSLMID